MKQSIICLSISLGIAAICGFSGCSDKSAKVDYATISFFIGDVNKNGSSVAIGDPVSENDSISTGPQSSCDVKIGGSIIRIKEKSKMAFSAMLTKDGIEKTSLDLGEGRLLCKPKKLLKGDSFTVKTPTAIAAVRGTEFTIETDAAKTTRIKVYDGKVKVAKRVKPLEDKIDQVMENITPVDEKESVIITEKEVAVAEKSVTKILEQNKSADIATISSMVHNDVAITDKDIKAFKVEDFKKENSELIDVKSKEPEIITKIKEVSKLPAPEGRLLITRYEVYFIKNGRVEWEGKIVTPPVKKDNRIYIASEDYVFCASTEGPVFWKKEIINDGKIEIKNKNAVIFVNGKEQKLDIMTGNERM